MLLTPHNSGTVCEICRNFVCTYTLITAEGNTKVSNPHLLLTYKGRYLDTCKHCRACLRSTPPMSFRNCRHDKIEADECSAENMRLVVLLSLFPLVAWLLFCEKPGPQVFQASDPAEDLQASSNTSLNSASKDSTPLEYTDKLAQILTSAMAEGKPMIHLVTVKVMKPFRMFICTECHCDICDFVLRFGYFAPIESMIFHHILTQGSGCTNSDALVVDAGANVGYFSLLAAAYGCRVVAFEPNVKARLYLEASAALHEDNLVEVHSQALGEKNGSVELEEATIWGLNKIVSTNGTWPKLQTEVEATNKSGPLRGDVEKISSNITSRSFSQAVGGTNAPVMPTIPNSQTGVGRKLQIEVETIQLDSIVQESILLFKIDTEGFEPHILAGSMSVIKQKGVKHIVMEVKDRGLKAIREMLWRLMIEGDFPFVYNYQEFYLGKQDHSGQYLPIEKYDLGTENIVDVSDIILNQKNDATMYEDFWFTKERLPWLTPG